MLLTCFKCKEVQNDPESLFNHLKVIHKLCGTRAKFECTMCWSSFEHFSSFKTNVRSCFQKYLEDDPEILDDDMYTDLDDQEVFVFREKLKKTAIEMVCQMSSNMSRPRKDVYDTIIEFKKYNSAIISGT